MGGALIEARPVGSTGLQLSRIGFGSAPIGDLKRAPSDETSRALLQAVWDAGVRYFDTAPFYGSGLSERRVGDFLRDKPRDSYVLSTKVGRLLVPDRDWAQKRYANPRVLPFRPEFDFSYDGIMRSYEASLQRLGLDRIDILYLHDLGRFSQKENHEATLAAALNGGIRALEELRASGAVRAIGAGVNEAPILETLLDHGRWDVFLLANRYTLIDQAVVEGLLPRCLKEGVAVVAGAPLSSGILATGPVPGALFDYAPASEAMLERVRRIEAVCRSYDVTLIRAALAFPLGHPAITALIPGPANPAEFADNLTHFRANVPAGLWHRLKAEGLLHPEAPAPLTPILPAGP